MAQNDMNVANQGFPAFRADLNDQLEALVTNSSGATEPSTKFSHQFWVDTAADPSVLKIRNETNDAWITIGEIDQTGDKFNLNCANATIAENLSLNAQGDLRFFDSDSSNYVAFQAPATVSSNVTWTLPSADGTSGQALTTNGSGTLSWVSAGGIPAGTVITVAMNTAPTGYLKANGAVVSRSTYAALFAAIGTTFGAGDGSTTFALPDLRGEFIRGWDDGRGVDSGRAFGSAQADEFKSHTHDLIGGTGTPNNAQQGVAGATPNPPTNKIGGALASGGAETRPRNVALLACIKF